MAALVVAFGHGRGLFLPSFTGAPAAAQTAAQAHAEPILAPLTIGHQAVMVFFVLSGYLVGGSVLKSFAADRWRWSDYLVKRIVRLWVVLVPALIVGALIDAIGFHFLAQAGGIYSAPAGQDYVTPDQIKRGFDIWNVFGNMLFLQGVSIPTAGTNIALWSLANEFWYYLMFPTILLIVRRDTPFAGRIACALAVAAIVALIGADATYLFLVWTLGAMVALMPRKIPSRWAGLVVLLASLLFVGVFLKLKSFGLPIYGSEMALGVLTASLIYAIKCQDRAGDVSGYSRASRFFSDISYTLYVTHVPFLIFVCAIVNAPWTRRPASPATVAQFAAVMALAIVWAWILYLLFESRTDRARRLARSGLSKLAGVSARLSASQRGLE
jgi:peptidoglycan/LPS O-acetylase OafA/YrhL